MARNQGGGRFSKILEFIGLVDEDDRSRRDPRDDREYDRQGYGRGSTYDPRSSRNADPRRNTRTQNTDRAYGNTGRRSGNPYEEDDELDMRGGRRSRERDDYGTRPNPAMNRTSAAGNYGRAARFTEEGDREARERAANMPARREQQAPSHTRMVMLSLQRLEDCCDVIDNLIAGNVVLMTMDDLDVKMYQRVVDTLSGSVYALKAKIRKASDRTYLVAPGHVDIDDNEYVARNF